MGADHHEHKMDVQLLCHIAKGPVLKLPEDKDVCDLKGQIDEFYIDMR